MTFFRRRDFVRRHPASKLFCHQRQPWSLCPAHSASVFDFGFKLYHGRTSSQPAFPDPLIIYKCKE